MIDIRMMVQGPLAGNFVIFGDPLVDIGDYIEVIPTGRPYQVGELDDDKIILGIDLTVLVSTEYAPFEATLKFLMPSIAGGLFHAALEVGQRSSIVIRQIVKPKYAFYIPEIKELCCDQG